MYTGKSNSKDVGWSGADAYDAIMTPKTTATPHTPQVAIITGSGQGVGAAAALLFAEQGAKVVVTDIDASKSDQVRHQRYNESIFSGAGHSAVRLYRLHQASGKQAERH